MKLISSLFFTIVFCFLLSFDCSAQAARQDAARTKRYRDNPALDSIRNDLATGTWVPCTDWTDIRTNLTDEDKSKESHYGQLWIFVNATMVNLKALTFSKDHIMKITYNGSVAEHTFSIWQSDIILGRFDAITSFGYILDGDILTIGDYADNMKRFIKFKRKK